MIENYELNDIVQMKKDHPCHKSHLWQIVRTGVDIKIKCLGCGSVIMMERREFERKCKKLVTKADDIKEDVKVVENVVPESLGHYNGVELFNDVPHIKDEEVKWITLNHGVACPKCKKITKFAILIDGVTWHKHSNHYWKTK